MAAKLTEGLHDGGRITSLGLEVSGAPTLVARVQVDLEEDGAARSVSVAVGTREIPVSGRRVSARVRLEGAQGWELVSVGPRGGSFGSSATVGVGASNVSPPMVTLTPAEPRFRPAAWSLGGTGAAALVAGAIFGVRATLLRGEIAGARGGRRHRGHDPARALDLEQQALSSAIVANTAFIAGAVLLVGGVVLWFLGNAG